MKQHFFLAEINRQGTEDLALAFFRANSKQLLYRKRELARDHPDVKASFSGVLKIFLNWQHSIMIRKSLYMNCS